MTTRTILFDSPFLLGFDQTRALIDRAAKAAAESYPPYNVEQRGDNEVRITLAVAGFTPEDLTITLEGRQLTIAGKREDGGKGRSGLPASRHRGARLHPQLRPGRRSGGRGRITRARPAARRSGPPDDAKVVQRIPIRAG
jgi:hypothetical protein